MLLDDDVRSSGHARRDGDDGDSSRPPTRQTNFDEAHHFDQPLHVDVGGLPGACGAHFLTPGETASGRDIGLSAERVLASNVDFLCHRLHGHAPTEQPAPRSPLTPLLGRPYLLPVPREEEERELQEPQTQTGQAQQAEQQQQHQQQYQQQHHQQHHQDHSDHPLAPVTSLDPHPLLTHLFDRNLAAEQIDRDDGDPAAPALRRSSPVQPSGDALQALLAMPPSPHVPMLSPGNYAEDASTHSLEAALATAPDSGSPSVHVAGKPEARSGSDSSHSSRSGKVPGFTPVLHHDAQATRSRAPDADAADALESQAVASLGAHHPTHHADGVGGLGLGTAATGDLGERHDFESLADIRAQVAALEADLNAKHPERALSGRIIHVSHYIPFVIRALAEVDFERKKEARLNAAANVAAMAAAIRAKKAAKEAAERAEAERLDRIAAGEYDATAGAPTGIANGDDATSRKVLPKPRQGSFLEGMSETTDLEKRLAENQARSRLKAGRRAWMMTPVVDEDGDGDDDDGAGESASEKDAYTPVGSRRGSTWTEASGRHMSFVHENRFSAVSDENSPLRTPPPAPARAHGGGGKHAGAESPVPPPPPPQWVLAPRRGHTALNSGIRSLCATHRQTFIGWPGDLQFAAQARSDERKDSSETTAEERRQIEQVLASLDDPKNWAEQEAPVLGAQPGQGQGQAGAAASAAAPAASAKAASDAARGGSAATAAGGAPKAAGAEVVQMSRLPTPIMNGAEPVSSGSSGSGGGGAGGGGAGDGGEGTENGIKYVPVWLEYNVAHGHYEGYCKTTLWPLLHYLLWQDVPESRRVNWEDYSWEAYHAANEAYARRIADEYRPGDLVWIHDYHLLLVPQMLRKLVPDAHIGLFVHAPFPSSEVFRCLPQRREILEGMLGADLACFQAFSYSRHFLSSCIRVCGFEASANTVESSNGHVTNISYNPIGIDAAKIQKNASAPGVLPKIETIRAMYRGKKIVVGRDKLDVVRGVIQKLQGFHKFLEEFPEWREKVVLIQVTAPALNDSPLLERKVSELVSQINGDFGSLSFTPVHHYHQIIERDEYFALLSVADLALITSVRDGMNTTSMEFIVAQERYGKNPLVLSEFTGTAGRMRAALQVNPWNVSGVAKMIHYGLSMSEEEKLARHDQLFRQVVSHTSHSWAATLVRQLLMRLSTEQSAHFTPPLERREMVDKFKSARRRLFCLDYDGTLTPIVKDPEAALPSRRLLEALRILSEDARNVLYIISGRDQRFLTKHLGHLRNLGFSAEHGGYVREPGEEQWQNLTEELDMTWMRDVRKIFAYFTERTSGSFIEEKRSSMTWHYRNADPDYGSFQAKECQAHLDNMCAQQNLAVEVLVGKKNLECRPLAVNKGEIVRRLLYRHADAEFVFCAGDDKTDEDMFRALCGLAASSSSSSASASGSASGSGTAKVPGVDATKPGAAAGPTSPQMGRPKAAPTGRASAGSAGASTVGEGTCGARGEEAVAAAAESSASPLPPPPPPLVMSPPTPLNAATTTPPAGSAPRALRLRPDGIYTTTIGAAGKKTLAQWHVDAPQRVIDALAEMAGMDAPEDDAPSDAAAAAAAAAALAEETS